MTDTPLVVASDRRERGNLVLSPRGTRRGCFADARNDD